MTLLIAFGTLLTIAGCIGLFFCVRKAVWLRRADLDEAAIRESIRQLMIWHMAAIGGAFFGLGLIFVGLLLG